MAAVEQELEEGEITDSDSVGDEDVKENSTVVKLVSKAQDVKQHSMFSDNLRSAHTFQPILRPPDSDSDSSDAEDSESESDDNRWAKQSRFPEQNISDPKPNKFVNPNFVKNGGVMPPLPKPSSKNVWGSVLQEQILTAKVGSCTMEGRVQNDRDVETYNYKRAAEDDRPILYDKNISSKQDELFGELVDLEQAVALQQQKQKRKGVQERLGKRRDVRQRPRGRHPITAQNTVEEVVYHISSTLHEAKVHLIRRVVQEIGRVKSLDLLKQTEEREAAGGMMTMNGARRRTPGGVYLQLLKTDPEVSKEQCDKIFEEENKWFLEQKKRKKAKARRRKWEQQLAQEEPGSQQTETVPAGPMELENSPDRRPDPSATSVAGEGRECVVGDAESDRVQEGEGSDSDSRGCFNAESEQELKRQAENRVTWSDTGMCDVDVLQIEAEDDIFE